MLYFSKVKIIANASSYLFGLSYISLTDIIVAVYSLTEEVE